MGLTTTSLLNAEKFPVIVPNSLFSSQVGTNFLFGHFFHSFCTNHFIARKSLHLAFVKLELLAALIYKLKGSVVGFFIFVRKSGKICAVNIY